MDQNADKYCDLVVKCKDGDYKTSKWFLTLALPYFRTTSSLQNTNEVFLEESLDDLKAMLCYVFPNQSIFPSSDRTSGLRNAIKFASLLIKYQVDTHSLSALIINHPHLTWFEDLSIVIGDFPEKMRGECCKELIALPPEKFLLNTVIVKTSNVPQEEVLLLLKKDVLTITKYLLKFCEHIRKLIVEVYERPKCDILGIIESPRYYISFNPEYYGHPLGFKAFNNFVYVISDSNIPRKISVWDTPAANMRLENFSVENIKWVMDTSKIYAEFIKHLKGEFTPQTL